MAIKIFTRVMLNRSQVIEKWKERKKDEESKKKMIRNAQEAHEAIRPTDIKTDQ